MDIDKSGMKDYKGAFITQSLFLEIGYDTDFAVYTFKEKDHEYKGKVYPSIKRLYLEHEDPPEYDFATTYFYSWNHWQRLCGNKIILKEISEWREELELKLRSQAIKDIIDNSAEGSYQASKWLADRGWDKQAVGRPSKVDKVKEAKMQDRLTSEFGGEVKRMSEFR